MTTASSPPKPGFFLKRSPREFLAMFLHWWWLGLLAGIAAGVPLYFNAPKPDPLYRSDVSLLYESKQAKLLNIQQVVDSAVRSADEINTQMELLRSKTFLEYLFSSFTPDEVKLIQSPYADPAKPDAPLPSLGEIIPGNVQIYVRRGTTILGIGVTNRSPDAAALIANRYARKYIDFNLDQANTGTNSAIIFLRNQVEESRADLEAAEKALQAFRERHNMATLGETKEVTLQKMASLGTSIVQAELALLTSQATLDKIADYRKQEKNLAELPPITESPAVSAALNALLGLQTQRNQLEQRYLRKHPKMQQNDFDTAEARRLLAEGIERRVLELETLHRVSQQHLERLRKEMAEVEVQARQLDRTAVDFRFLEQEAQTKRNAYARIVERLNEAKIASQMENTNIKIFDTAVASGRPINSPTGTMLLRSVAAGGACLLILPFLVGFLDNRLRTPYHVEHVLGQRLLGAIKPLGRKLSDADKANAFRTQEDEGLVEAWRGIYSEIELCSSVGYPKFVLVSSGSPKEGKSQVASNLAAVFASHHRRTLLVDCDLRWPRLHAYLERRPASGWVDWLRQPAAERPALPPAIVGVDTHLDFLPAGKAPPDPTKVIDDLSRKEVLEAFGQRYDVVIFDTPPAGIFPDALLLARSCHELVYVIAYAKVRAGAAFRLLERFREVGISVLGVVLNRLPESRITGYGAYHGYGSYGSKYYKSYGKEKPAAVEE